MTFSEQLPSTEMFFELFETTGWNTKYELTKDELYLALKNSWYTISVYENENLIGFGRIICDGVVHALILDVIVLPEKQGKGIGRLIMDKLVVKCKQNKIRDIQLFCAKGKKVFYEKLGFEIRPEDGPGMQIEKYY
jgi:GNAT superfamily N-acetyltransferase